jgi:hypothetical protein
VLGVSVKPLKKRLFFVVLCPKLPDTMATAVLGPTEISARHHIPTLDGWRGVAILLVLAEHAGQYGPFKDFVYGGVPLMNLRSLGRKVASQPLNLVRALLLRNARVYNHVHHFLMG